MIKRVFFESEIKNTFKSIKFNQSSFYSTIFKFKNIDNRKTIYLNKFNFITNNPPKIIRIIKDENNKNKIEFKDFDDFEKEKKITENNPNKIKNPISNKSKLKLFGEVKIETNIITNDNSKNKPNKKENDDENTEKFNVFDNLDNQSIDNKAN